MQLSPLERVLGPVLEAVRPVRPEHMPVEAAGGLVLAADIRAGIPVPAGAVALRDGLAVCAAELVGAAPSSPLILSAMPARVRAGDLLPAGCDGVLDADLAVGLPPLVEIIEGIAPGHQVRLAGHDLAATAVIAPVGTRITPVIVLAARLAGETHVEVRAPRVAVDLADEAVGGWMAAYLHGLGCRIMEGRAAADLYLRDAGTNRPRLAIRPGDTGWVEHDGDRITIDVPARFDGALGALSFLILPVLARLFGASVTTTVLPLAGKIVSAIGTSDLALLARDGSAFLPLAAGEIPLRALVRASHVLVVPPGEEGLDAGEPAAAISLATPFAFGQAIQD